MSRRRWARYLEVNLPHLDARRGDLLTVDPQDAERPILLVRDLSPGETAQLLQQLGLTPPHEVLRAVGLETLSGPPRLTLVP